MPLNCYLKEVSEMASAIKLIFYNLCHAVQAK